MRASAPVSGRGEPITISSRLSVLAVRGLHAVTTHNEILTASRQNLKRDVVVMAVRCSRRDNRHHLGTTVATTYHSSCVYIAEIGFAYLSRMTRRLSLRVGVSSALSAVHSSGKIVHRRIFSTRDTR